MGTAVQFHAFFMHLLTRHLPMQDYLTIDVVAGFKQDWGSLGCAESDQPNRAQGAKALRGSSCGSTMVCRVWIWHEVPFPPRHQGKYAATSHACMIHMYMSH